MAECFWDESQVTFNRNQLSLVPRRRVCRSCHFSTSDPGEFYRHQATAHSSLAPPTGGDTDPSDDRNNNDKSAVEVPPTGSGSSSDDGSGSPLRRVFRCSVCDETTHSAKLHLRHLVVKHGRTFEIFECEMCDYATRYQEKLPRHQECHFGKVTPVDAVLTHGGATMAQTDEDDTFDRDVLSRDGSPRNALQIDIPKEEPLKVAMNGEMAPHDHVELKPPGTNVNINSCAVWQVAPLETVYPDDNLHIDHVEEKVSPNRLTLKLSKLGAGKVDGNIYADRDLGDLSVVYGTGKVEESSGMHIHAALTGDVHRVEGKSQIESLLELERATQHQYPVGIPNSGLKRKVYSAVREAVDPAKYVIIHEIDGTKFACSRCGNIYKWRKSLNKHWKEKHDGEVPPALPAGLVPVARGRGTPKGKGVMVRTLKKMGGGLGGALKVIPVTAVSDVKWAGMRLTRAAPFDSYLPTPPDIRPPSAHSHHYQPPLTPDVAVDLSLQQHLSFPSAFHPYGPNMHDDDDDNALDLSRTGLNMKQEVTSLPPPQDEPLDFTLMKPNVKVQSVKTCQRCKQRFATTGELTQHAELCQDGRKPEASHACHVCGEAFVWKRALADHFLREHAPRKPVLPEFIPDLQCGQCEFVASNSSELARHYLKHSLSSRSLSCRLCSFRAVQPLQLSVHYSVEHAKTETAPEAASGRVIDLTADGTVIVIPQAPEDHDLASAELLLPYKCSVCEYRARWPSEISQHMKNHSDEKPYHCPRCAYRSKWKWDVVKHLKRCGGGTVQDVIDMSKQIMVMPLDGASPGPSPPQQKREVTQRPVLSRGPPNVTVVEEETEDNSGQLYCEKCAFVGHSAAELQRHMRVHFDEKPFICRTCGYCSKWKCDLKKHLRAYDHTPATPLVYGGHGRKPSIHEMMQAPQADEGTPQPLYTSTQSGDTVNRYQCEYCDWSGSRLGLLTEHKRMAHKAPELDTRVSVWAGGSGTVYGCKQCAFTASSERVARRHAYWHGRQLHYTCAHCDYSRHSSKQVNTHMKMFHSKPRAAPTIATTAYFVQHTASGVRYRCRRCAWATADKQRMLRHKHARVHHCVKCARVCLSAELLVRHVARVHDKPMQSMHTCVYCPFVGDASAIVVHRRHHGARSRYVCDYCNFSIARLGKVFSHRHVHAAANDDFKPIVSRLSLIHVVPNQQAEPLVQ